MKDLQFLTVQGGEGKRERVVIVGVDYPHRSPLNGLQRPGLCRRET